MKRRSLLASPVLAAPMLAAPFLAASGAHPGAGALADPILTDSVLALYRRFYLAQNARDLAAVSAVLSDAPTFLWISDGKPYWGRDAMLERMSAFQKAEVWEVTPDFARSKVVALGADSALLHQPLALTLGPKADPRRIAFLVHVLCARSSEGWRIAALFTTDENPA